MIDESGRIISRFDDSIDGLYGAIDRITSEPRRGKSIVAVPCDLPFGYAVFCVIDHDTDALFFIVCAPGRLLLKQYSTLAVAISAAFDDANLEPNPEPKPPL